MPRRTLRIPKKPPVHRTTSSRIQEEVFQGHGTRVGLYKDIQQELGPKYKVVSLFTSFLWPVSLTDSDADMLEEVLRGTINKGERLALILNCPGGEALAAERIINICRTYSTNGFIVIVPKMAKSAATMVCLGADEIWMSPTSELGPIDPQIPIMVPGRQRVKYLAAHEILNSFNDLMKKANRTKGRIDPFLQQLSRFDARDIQWIISAQKLSDSIAVRTLQSGVMRNRTQAYIRRKMRPFLDPTYAKVHGRPVYHDVARKCGLDIKLQDIRGRLWESVWHLYVRLDHVLSSPMSMTAKAIESVDDLYTAQAHIQADDDDETRSHDGKA